MQLVAITPAWSRMKPVRVLCSPASIRTIAGSTSWTMSFGVSGAGGVLAAGGPTGRDKRADSPEADGARGGSHAETAHDKSLARAVASCTRVSRRYGGPPRSPPRWICAAARSPARRKRGPPRVRGEGRYPTPPRHPGVADTSHADLLPARTRAMLGLARRQRAVGVVEPGYDIGSDRPARPRLPQGAPPRSATASRARCPDRSLDRPVLEASGGELARQLVDRRLRRRTCHRACLGDRQSANCSASPPRHRGARVHLTRRKVSPTRNHGGDFQYQRLPTNRRSACLLGHYQAQRVPQIVASSVSPRCVPRCYGSRAGTYLYNTSHVEVCIVETGLQFCATRTRSNHRTRSSITPTR